MGSLICKLILISHIFIQHMVISISQIYILSCSLEGQFFVIPYITNTAAYRKDHVDERGDERYEKSQKHQDDQSTLPVHEFFHPVIGSTASRSASLKKIIQPAVHFAHDAVLVFEICVIKQQIYALFPFLLLCKSPVMKIQNNFAEIFVYIFLRKAIDICSESHSVIHNVHQLVGILECSLESRIYLFISLDLPESVKSVVSSLVNLYLTKKIIQIFYVSRDRIFPRLACKVIGGFSH